MESFFRRYADIFLEQNIEALSSLYRFPMTFYTEAGDAVSFDKAPFDDNSARLFAHYDKLGVSHIGFDIQDEYSVSDNLKLVSVIWYFRAADMRLIYQATTRYLLNTQGASPVILSVFVIDEVTNSQSTQA